MTPNGGTETRGMDQIDTMPPPSNGIQTVHGARTNGGLIRPINGINSPSNGNFLQQRGGRMSNASVGGNQASPNGTHSTTSPDSSPSPTKDPNNCFIKAINKVGVFLIKCFSMSSCFVLYLNNLC